MSVSHPNDQPHFDPEALRKKYLEERDKRLRPDGSEQYRDMAGELSHYLDDPYVKPGFSREPITADVDALVIGGGFAGLQAAAHLKEAGIENIRIIERAGDFGGTWYWNRYPGCACDVESYIYFPLLEQVGGMPTEKYAKASEIFEHARRIGRHYDLYPLTSFQTKVNDMRWDATAARWVVHTDRGDVIRARFVCLGSGPLNKPKLPGIPGIESFLGHAFHTSRWDYAYTGGDAAGNMAGLKNKRVAVIGTGATAVQCVPHLAASAKELLVFQRTPSAVGVRDNRPTDPEWVKSLTPGWQERRTLNFESLIAGIPQDEDLVADGWTAVWSKLFLMVKQETDEAVGPADQADLRQLADFTHMEEVRARVDKIVRDPATAAALKPYYNLFCKRPCFHDEYLDSFNLPNVTLVDTQGHGVERISANAVCYGGKSYEVDCIVFATGFEVGAEPGRAGGFDIIGRDGRSLNRKWSEGVQSLHGMFVREFPNMAIVGGLKHASVTVTIPYLVGKQCAHFAALVKRCMDSGVAAMEVSQAAEDGWGRTIREKAFLDISFSRDCTPGYYNNEGRVEDSLFTSFFGGGPFEYMNILGTWRKDGFDRDMEATMAVTASA